MFTDGVGNTPAAVRRLRRLRCKVIDIPIRFVKHSTIQSLNLIFRRPLPSSCSICATLTKNVKKMYAYVHVPPTYI